jgi:hypothetical protein
MHSGGSRAGGWPQNAGNGSPNDMSLSLFAVIKLFDFNSLLSVTLFDLWPTPTSSSIERISSGLYDGGIWYLTGSRSYGFCTACFSDDGDAFCMTPLLI